MQMQPKSISMFLFWLTSWAQAHLTSKIPRQSEMQNIVVKTWSGGKTIGLSAEEGRNMIFRDHDGESHSNSVLGKAMEIEKAGGRGLGTGSDWNAQSLKCRWTRDSMWREWKQMQPVTCAKFWDLAWCERQDWNYFLLEERIMYTAMKRRSNGEQSGLVNLWGGNKWMLFMERNAGWIVWECEHGSTWRRLNYGEGRVERMVGGPRESNEVVHRRKEREERMQGIIWQLWKSWTTHNNCKRIIVYLVYFVENNSKLCRTIEYRILIRLFNK